MSKFKNVKYMDSNCFLDKNNRCKMTKYLRLRSCRKVQGDFFISLRTIRNRYLFCFIIIIIFSIGGYFTIF